MKDLYLLKKDSFFYGDELCCYLSDSDQIPHFFSATQFDVAVRSSWFKTQPADEKWLSTRPQSSPDLNVPVRGLLKNNPSYLVILKKDDPLLHVYPLSENEKIEFKEKIHLEQD